MQDGFIYILTTADNASYGSILVDFLIQAFMLLKKNYVFIYEALFVLFFVIF